VASALRQTVREIEVVVVDDGSTDDTREVVRSFRDDRLRLVRKVNGGLSSARNLGIAHARAAFIGLLDGDDRWHPAKAERHLALMERDPTIGISFSHSAYIDEAGRATGRVLFTSLRQPTLRQLVLRNCIGNGSTPILRAACFEAAGGFDETLRSCEDWEMWVRILRDTGYTAVLVPEVLTDYRLNPRSLSADFAGFLTNAERAAGKIRAQTPALPARVVNRGLAMSYRIAGTKALQLGNTAAAASLLARAIGKSPALIVTDPRLLGTVAAMAMPKQVVDAGHRLLGGILKSRRPPLAVHRK
jgi:glycosyltransferase involved in cell wall biosynthesis